jgi:prepilin-type N-terminal cleavage/methylation domain-containing protein
MKKNNSKVELVKKGFTLVEMMISVTLFTIVVMSTIEATMTATSAYRRTEALRISQDTLSFVMEDMNRNMKLGTHFDCSINLGSITQPTPISSFTPCNNNQTMLALAFDPQTADPDPTNLQDNTVYQLFEGRLYKSTDGGQSLVPILPPEITLCLPFSTDISCANRPWSGFVSRNNIATGAPLIGSFQPYVTVKLSGYTIVKGEPYHFFYQTTITPRGLNYEI